jgi:hypothetical protein
MSLTISHAETSEQREAVYRLRYTMLVEELRRTSSLADHQCRRIEEPLDVFARFLIACEGDTVVAAQRVNLLAEGEIAEESTFYGLSRFRDGYPHAIAISAPTLVAPGFRNSPLPLRLAVAAYDMCLSEGITHDFVACEPEREAFYLSLGYRPYREHARNNENVEVIPMVLLLRDLTHLDLIGSPLAVRLREYQRDSHAKAVG